MVSFISVECISDRRLRMFDVTTRLGLCGYMRMRQEDMFYDFLSTCMN